MATMPSHRDGYNVRHKFQTGPEDGSATPPPIAGGRRLIIDEKAYDQDYSVYDSAPSPVTVIADGRDGDRTLNRSQSASRIRYQGFSPALPVRSPIRAPIPQHQHRTPVLDYRSLYPMSENGHDPRDGDTLPFEPVDEGRINEELGYPEDYQNGHIRSPRLMSPYLTSAQEEDARHMIEARSYFSKETDNMSISRQSAASSGSSRLPDFFGPGIFQVVLHNPTTAHQLLKFSQTRFCSENVEFLAKVEQYNKILNDLTKTMTDIHKEFIAPEAPNQINLPDATMRAVHTNMKTIVTSTLPAMESIFLEVQEKIEHLVFSDIYPRFVRYQMTQSATRALATDRNKYQGLGDCFCLTNPSKADNPIVYASDGFVKTTGYSRQEIIPRNCRFLQGQHTDKTPIRRLKECINDRKESVELILNYKKNGEPFWNLLYVAPLFNAQGKVAFFIGGQINCSTTIHSNADVMRILSTSGDVQQAKEVQIPQPLKDSSSFSRRGLFKAFSSKESAPVVSGAGMEHGLLNRLEGADLTAQMKEFYTAYSKYIVFKYDSSIIEFCSGSVSEFLNPAILANTGTVGQDVFKFLKQNMLSTSSDFKAKARASLRSGYSVSIELRLQTRRSAMFRGDERFVSHWTPVKDENASVGYVVVCLSPASR